MALFLLTGLLLAAGALLYALIHFEYKGREEVYNLLGLNPVAKWQGKDAPPFSLQNMRTGATLHSKQLKDKVVLLDFWASWCPSCRKQMPILERIHTDPALQGKVQVLTINMKDPYPPKAIVGYLNAKGYTFPVLKGTDALVKQYGIWFFPALVILTRGGKVFYTAAELHDEAKIRQKLKEALKIGS